MKRPKFSVSVSLDSQELKKIRWAPFLIGFSAGMVFLTFYNFFWIPIGQYILHF